MNHTPTPWHKEKDRPKVRNASDVTVADCGSYHVGSLEKRQANAAFIVKACNAHDALLEAARLVVAGGDQCFCHAGGPISWGRHRLGLGPGPCDYCVAKAAIALTEGGKEA